MGELRLKRMKKWIAVCIIAAMAACIPASLGITGLTAYADAHREDMRAAWISTVWNVDFPSVKNSASLQKQEFINKLDTLKASGINTVVVQVRPRADALYKSNINPWSDVLTGIQGKDPGYDPMAFMIEETHKRGMSFHAWLNPYRITTSTGTVSGGDTSSLTPSHPAKLHPEWTIAYKDALYYNPELPEVKQHISDTVAEIVDNYDVDGIHFDDYFYPSGYPLPAGEGRDGAVANARREHVNQMIAQVYNTIKARKPSVLFGVSPVGIWKNASSDPSGSATKGNEGYYSVYGDAKAWISAGTVDYIVPQIYWKIGFAAADYETLVKWWSSAVTGTNVSLYIGQAIYTDAVAQEIDKHLVINEKYPNVKGDFYFSAADIFNNRLGCRDLITAHYNSAGVPPQTSAFADIPAGEWYAEDVKAASGLGIILGKGNNLFDPNGKLSVAEAITLAVKTRNLTEGTTFTEGGTNWYDNAVNYALEKGMISADSFSDYNAIITREQMAYLFASALSEDGYKTINNSVTVPDIAGSPYSGEIEKLYASGILTGSGEDFAFLPKDNIRRCEAAAIIHRVAVAEKRIQF